MDVAEHAKPQTLDAQYFVQGNIMAIRMRFLELAKYQFAFMCRVKPYPNRIIQEGDFNHLLLIDHIWGGCGEMEFIDLNGSQTGVGFYLPGRVELSEIDEYENAIRKNFSRPRIGLWLWENLGWTPKVIELFAEELYEHRVNSLQHIQGLAVDKLGLGTYPLSYFQIPPAPKTGISQMQSNNQQPTVGISQIQPESQRPQAGVNLPQPENPQPPTRIFQNQPYDPNLQVGISQIQTENSELETGVDRDIPREHPTKESDIALTKEDCELLRLWNNGLTAKEIGLRIGKADKTVANRLSVLRGMYGERRIPLRKTPTRKDLG